MIIWDENLKNTYKISKEQAKDAYNRMEILAFLGEEKAPK
jgi:hypothetical protein